MLAFELVLVVFKNTSNYVSDFFAPVLEVVKGEKSYCEGIRVDVLQNLADSILLFLKVSADVADKFAFLIETITTFVTLLQRYVENLRYRVLYFLAFQFFYLVLIELLLKYNQLFSCSLVTLEDSLVLCTFQIFTQILF